MQYQTPQFINIEDKVIGPFTIKQFFYIAGGIGLCALMYRFLPFFLFLILATPIIALSGALAFYRHNDRPFIEILEAGFNYLTRSRMYLWRHRKPADITKELNAVEAPTKQQPINPSVGLSSSKLRDLSWGLEVKEDEDAVQPQTK